MEPSALTKPAIPRLLLAGIATLVIAASALGLSVPGFYADRTNAITSYEIAGQDAVSLIVGLLLLFVGSLRVRGGVSAMLAAGLLLYSSYTYSYFAFGLLSSRIYVTYLAIAGLSFYSLLATIVAAARGESRPAGRGARAVGIYLIVVVALVGFIDAKDVVVRTTSANRGMGPKEVFYVLDLAFLFPAMVIAAVLNMKAHSLGPLLAGAALVKTIALMPALILSDVLHYQNTGTFVDFGFDVIALVVMASAVVFFVIHARDCRSDHEILDVPHTT
jgi:hypothetical protein